MSTYQSSYTGAEIDQRLDWAGGVPGHITASLNTEEGIHGIRWFNDTLEYYDGLDWIEIETGGSGGGGFIVKDLYPTLSALLTAHPTGSVGDAYAVGTEISNQIYIWSVVTSAWVNIGTLRGEKGDPGINGTNGADGINGTDGAKGADGINGIDGTDGVDGRGIVSVTRTSGTGSPGTTDTYTITYTDSTTSTFNVYNGADGSGGSGAGDMLKSVYDPTGKNTDIFAYAVPTTRKINGQELTGDITIPTGGGSAAETTYDNTESGLTAENMQDAIDESANIISTNVLLADKTIYVATTGNDTTGDGSAGAPYATITKAKSVIPKNLNGFMATINIAAGTYVEAVTLYGYHGGKFRLTTSGTVNINSMTITDCAEVVFGGTGSYIFGTGSVPNVLLIQQSIVTTSTTVTISVAGTTETGAIFDSSIISIFGTFSFGTNDAGLYARYGAQVYINAISGGTVVSYGIVAQSGGQVSYTTASYTAGTLTVTQSGGRIYTGAQTSVPNY